MLGLREPVGLHDNRCGTNIYKRNTTIFSAIALVSLTILSACGGSDSAATDTTAGAPATGVSLVHVVLFSVVIVKSNLRTICQQPRC